MLVGILMLTAPIWAKQAALKTVYIRTEDSDGNGDIIFRHETSVGSRGRKRSRSVGFIGIRDVREVELKIRELRDVVALRSEA